MPERINSSENNKNPSDFIQKETNLSANNRYLNLHGVKLKMDENGEITKESLISLGRKLNPSVIKTIAFTQRGKAIRDQNLEKLGKASVREFNLYMMGREIEIQNEVLFGQRYKDIFHGYPLLRDALLPEGCREGKVGYIDGLPVEREKKRAATLILLRNGHIQSKDPFLVALVKKEDPIDQIYLHLVKEQKEALDRLIHLNSTFRDVNIPFELFGNENFVEDLQEAKALMQEYGWDKARQNEVLQDWKRFAEYPGLALLQVRTERLGELYPGQEWVKDYSTKIDLSQNPALQILKLTTGLPDELILPRLPHENLGILRDELLEIKAIREQLSDDPAVEKGVLDGILAFENPKDVVRLRNQVAFASYFVRLLETDETEFSELLVKFRKLPDKERSPEVLRNMILDQHFDKNRVSGNRREYAKVRLKNDPERALKLIDFVKNADPYRYHAQSWIDQVKQGDETILEGIVDYVLMQDQQFFGDKAEGPQLQNLALFAAKMAEELGITKEEAGDLAGQYLYRNQGFTKDILELRSGNTAQKNAKAFFVQRALGGRKLSKPAQTTLLNYAKTNNTGFSEALGIVSLMKDPTKFNKEILAIKKANPGLRDQDLALGLETEGKKNLKQKCFEAMLTNLFHEQGLELKHSAELLEGLVEQAGECKGTISVDLLSYYREFMEVALTCYLIKGETYGNFLKHLKGGVRLQPSAIGTDDHLNRREITHLSLPVNQEIDFGGLEHNIRNNPVAVLRILLPRTLAALDDKKSELVRKRLEDNINQIAKRLENSIEIQKLISGYLETASQSTLTSAAQGISIGVPKIDLSKLVQGYKTEAGDLLTYFDDGGVLHIGDPFDFTTYQFDEPLAEPGLAIPLLTKGIVFAINAARENIAHTKPVDPKTLKKLEAAFPEMDPEFPSAHMYTDLAEDILKVKDPKVLSMIHSSVLAKIEAEETIDPEVLVSIYTDAVKGNSVDPETLAKISAAIKYLTPLLKLVPEAGIKKAIHTAIVQDGIHSAISLLVDSALLIVKRSLNVNATIQNTKKELAQPPKDPSLPSEALVKADAAKGALVVANREEKKQVDIVDALATYNAPIQEAITLVGDIKEPVINAVMSIVPSVLAQHELKPKAKLLLGILADAINVKKEFNPNTCAEAVAKLIHELLGEIVDAGIYQDAINTLLGALPLISQKGIE